MKTVRVIYHDDPDGWWAESPEFPGYIAYGETLEDVRADMREGLPWFAEQPLQMLHSAATPEGTPKPHFTAEPGPTRAAEGLENSIKLKIVA